MMALAADSFAARFEQMFEIRGVRVVTGQTFPGNGRVMSGLSG